MENITERIRLQYKKALFLGRPQKVLRRYGASEAYRCGVVSLCIHLFGRADTWLRREFDPLPDLSELQKTFTSNLRERTSQPAHASRTRRSVWISYRESIFPAKVRVSDVRCSAGAS